MNLLYQNGSLSNNAVLDLDMYLKFGVWYSERGIIGLSDEQRLQQDSLYTSLLCLFSPVSILCFDKNSEIYVACALWYLLDGSLLYD